MTLFFGICVLLYFFKIRWILLILDGFIYLNNLRGKRSETFHSDDGPSFETSVSLSYMIFFGGKEPTATFKLLHKRTFSYIHAFKKLI